MKVTAIKQQVKRVGRYSIFVDGAYSFSLSDIALLDAKIAVGQELDEQQLSSYRRLSDDDKIYNAVLNYLALRPRSVWEIEVYLNRKQASPSLIELILNKLSINNLINDKKFAEAFVNDRRLLRPTSKRRLILELRKKHIANEIITEVVNEETTDDRSVLIELVKRKRQQTRYQDTMKLMQYLAGQGFQYADIKAALQVDDTD